MNHVYCNKNFTFSGKYPLNVSPLVLKDLNKIQASLNESQAGLNKKNQARQLFFTALRHGENF